LVGSCNRDDFLNDTTGERRYWVIPVPNGTRLDRDKLCRMRDVIWKSILGLYRRGELPCLPDGLMEESEINNRSFSRESILGPYLGKYLKGKIMESKGKLREYAAGLDLVPSSMLDKEIMSTMVQIGWNNHKFRGVPRIWLKSDIPITTDLRDQAAQIDHTVRGRNQGW
jgi:hypothetical protein